MSAASLARGWEPAASVRGGADVVRALYAALPPVGTPEDTLRLVDDLERRFAQTVDEERQAA